MKAMCLVLGWTLLVMAAASAEAADPAPLLPGRVAHAITERMAQGEYPAMVVVVVDGDRSDVYGFGHLADGDAPDAATVFQIGSITKTFTATLLAGAVERGDVDLETSVESLLPGFTMPSRHGKKITLGELATQFSGLPRLPGNLKPTNVQDPYADYDAAKLKAFLAGYPLPRNPGDSYEYSNLGFGVLGYALAQRAGTSYGTLLQSRILEPLAMSATTAGFQLPPGPQWAPGHSIDGKPAQPWHLDVLAGAGVINSTGKDMLRYLEANMARGKDPLRKAMQFAQQPRRKVGNERIGLAWMIRHDQDGDVIWHNGMTGGYASFMGFTADGSRGVVILTNIARSVDDLGFATLSPCAPLAPSRKPVTMTPQQLDAYVGEYQLAPGFILSVFREGDQLNAEATGQGAFPIFASATDRFFARVAGITIDFRRGKGGRVEALVLRQGGRDTPAKRLDAATFGQAGGHPAMTLDHATLQPYVGRYQLAPGMVFDITLADGQLKARLTGQPAFPVYPGARDEFHYTVVDAQLTFKRGADGTVNALVLHQNGRDQHAPRIQ